MIPAEMDNHEWEPDHAKVFGLLVDPDPTDPKYHMLNNLRYVPLQMSSVHGEKPTRRYYQTRSAKCVINEGPYARSPAYAARIALATEPQPTYVGPTAMEIYEGSLPYRVGTDSYADGDMASIDAGLTSIGACLQFLYFNGTIDKYVWSPNVDDMLQWILWGCGPLLLDMPVYKEFTYDDGPTLTLDGPILGREVYLLNGVNYHSSEVRLMSVHGYDWGVKGMKRMSLSDFQHLCHQDNVMACGMIGKHVGVMAARNRDERRVEMNRQLTHYATIHQNTQKIRGLASQLTQLDQ